MAINHEQIRKEPRYPRIQFVDGYVAKIVSMRPAKDNNKDGWLMELEPFEELAKRYKLKSEQQYLQRFYPVEHVIQLSNDPIWTIYFCMTTFENQETPATGFFKGTAYIKQLEEKNEHINRLMSEKAKIARDLELAKRNIPLYLKENLGVMMDVMGPALRSILLESINTPAGASH